MKLISRIRVKRMVIRWRRWRNEVMKGKERLSRIQESAVRVAHEMISDRGKSTLEYCMYKTKRLITRGDDMVILYNGAIVLVGSNYYYVVYVPVAHLVDLENQFDEEMSKQVNRKIRMAMTHANAGIGSILAKADEPEHNDK